MKKIISMKTITRSTKIWVSIIAVIVIIILSILYTYRIFNLTIREGVMLELSPELSKITLTYGESTTLNINSEINNYWLCQATCTHSFTDLASGQIFSENFIVKNHKKVSYDAIINADMRGYGQKIYSYNIKCANIRTNVCPSGSDTYRRKATIVLDYSPNIVQLESINHVQNNFPSMAKYIGNSGVDIITALNIIKNLDIHFKDKDYADMYLSQYAKLRNEVDIIIELWTEKNYEGLDSSIQKIYPDIEILYNNSKNYLEQVVDTVNTYNTLISRQRDIITRSSIIKQYIKYYPYTDLSYQEFLGNTVTWLTLININTDMINLEENYSSTLFEQNYNLRMLEGIENTFRNSSNKSKDQYLDIYIAAQLTCTNCSYEYIEGIYMNNSLEELNLLMDKCRLAKEIIPMFEKRREENLARRIYQSENISLDAVDAQERIEMYYILQHSKDIKYYNKSDDYLSIINLALINQNISIDIYGVNSSDNFREYYSLSFQPFINNLMELKQSCDRPEIILTMKNVTRDIQVMPVIEINPDIPELPPITEECCIGSGSCNCCDGCDNYPLILLHGHSFNLENSAYSSTEIFNSLEDTLVEDGYVSFGTISPGDFATIKTDKKMLFKLTFYVKTEEDTLGFKIVQDKNGSISDYVERLTQQISYIKSVTGQSKVDIITHSMGGLVVRRYLLLYGKDSINKVIMIAPPNQGIDNRTAVLCKIFGEEKECDDMIIGSKIINELNTLKDYPDTYLIIGTGCDTNGKDGDGIVQKENVLIPDYYLKKIYYINGTCSPTDYLHTSILNIKRHPEVYKIIERTI